MADLSPEQQLAIAKKRQRRTMIVAAGAIIFGALCPYLPPEYQGPCDIVVKLMSLIGV